MVDIPSKVKIGFIEFDIDFPCKSFVVDSEIMGSTKQHIGLIEIRDCGSIFGNWGTLMHEILHEIDNAYLGAVLAEHEINLFSIALLQLVVNNNYNFHLATIPKSIMLGMLSLKIIYPHNFTDDIQRVIYCDRETSKIYLADSVIEKFSRTYIKYILTLQIIQLILEREYFFNYTFENFEEIADFPVESLTTGILCFFRDNPDFEQSVKKAWIEEGR